MKKLFGTKAKRTGALFVLAMVSVLAVCGFAQAEISMSTGPLAVDLPEGWSGVEGEGQIIFTAPQNAAALTITIDSLGGAILREVAAGLSAHFGGSEPEESEYWYSFTWKNPNGVDCAMYVMGSEERDILVTMTRVGNHPDMQGIIDSMGLDWDEAVAGLSLSSGPLSVVLPKGWSVVEGKGQIVFTAPQNAAMIMLQLDTLDGATIRQIAAGISTRLKGSEPVEQEHGYLFTWKNSNGIDCASYVMGNEEKGVFVNLTQVGSHPDIQGLLQSMDWNWDSE